MIKLSRRQIGIGLGGSAALAAASDPGRAADFTQAGFPQGFRWGCATAAYQIEGAATEDGRGLTNWDVFSHTPGKIADGQTGDVAADSYHRYREDTQLLKALGANSYRMSIAWSRIFPEGRGAVNQKGVDHYDRVIDNLLENRIEPYVTLFHWDLPAALPGGWRSRDTAKAYADYAGFMAARLSDRVGHLITINEFSCFTDLGHRTGIFAPGLKLTNAEANQVRHHGVLAHGLGVQAIRAHASRPVRVGLAENAIIYVPVLETPEHIAAAEAATLDANAPFLGAVMHGRYRDSYFTSQGADAPKIEAGDMAAIGSSLDFVGLNVYAPEYARADSSPKGYAIEPHVASSPHMASSWLYVGPEVLYWAARHASTLYKAPEILITENGCSVDDRLVDGRIEDADRITYLREYLSNLRRAVAEGYPVKGYFLWSLLDNFEWADGYTKRFGLYYVDFATQMRTPKLSAAWYREVISRNNLA